MNTQQSHDTVVSEEWKHMVEEAQQLVFDSDKDVLCSQMDYLVGLMGKVEAMGEDSTVFERKIRAGIMRLDGMGAVREAAFYADEIVQFQKKKTRNNWFLLIIFIASLFGLAVIGFSGGNSSFNFFEKIGNWWK
jgi:hypothetical protein